MNTPEIREIPVGDMIVDTRVQRTIDPNRVKGMAAVWDPRAAGTLTVSAREDGTFAVIDGQHRKEAAREAQGDKVTLTCRVFTGMTLEEEAHLFRLLNTTRIPLPVDRFRIRVAEKEDVAVSITSMLREYGWTVAHGRSAGMFAAVAAAERVYRLDPDALREAISTVTRAWGHDEMDGRVLEGIGLVLARYPDLDRAALIDRLGSYEGGPRGLLGYARQMSRRDSVLVPRAIAEIVVNTYNARRKTRAIPHWRSVQP